MAVRQAARKQLGWDLRRYADVRRTLEEQRRVLSGQGRRNDLPGPDSRAAGVSPSLRASRRAHHRAPGTGHGSAHAACDLTGVSVSVPGRGGATVPARPGSAIGNSKGFRLQVDARTLDVTITVTGSLGNA